MSTKPADFIERASKDFGDPGVDVATVPQNQKPEEMLFGKNQPPPVEQEPQAEEFFKWDADKELEGQKGAFYVDVDNNGRTERFWGKTRTEVTKNLAEGKSHLNKTLAEVKTQRPRQPDTKLPYDPIQRKAPRQLNPQEIYQISELAQTDPIRAQEMLFEARTGYTMDQVAQSVTMNEETRRKLYAAEVSGAFITRHQKDFIPNQQNMALIDGYLKERQWPVTDNNLEIAFHDLSEQGKLSAPVEQKTTPPATVIEFVPPPPPVSPPSRPAPAVVSVPGSTLSREEAAVIQSGSLDEARSVIQNVYRRNRSSR